MNFNEDAYTLLLKKGKQMDYKTGLTQKQLERAIKKAKKDGWQTETIKERNNQK